MVHCLRVRFNFCRRWRTRDVCVQHQPRKMVLTFFESYYDGEEKLVLDLKEIRWHYLRTWFMIDLVSSIPTDLILGLINGGTEGCDPFPYYGFIEAGG